MHPHLFRRLACVVYCNCLCGALLLYILCGPWKARLRAMRSDGSVWMPHFVVFCGGFVYDFKRYRDLLPFPLCYVLFPGRFRRRKFNGRTVRKLKPWKLAEVLVDIKKGR